MMDAEAEAAAVYQTAGLDAGIPAAPAALCRAVTGVDPLGAANAVPGVVLGRVVVQTSRSRIVTRWRVLCGTAEAWLRLRGMEEGAAAGQLLAAALLCPAPAWLALRECCGPFSAARLGAALEACESYALLRRAEVEGGAVALVDLDRSRVRARGEARLWPSDGDLIRAARAGVLPGLRAVRLGDRPGALAFVA